MSGPLQKYRYTSRHGVETVLKLNDAEAERLGLGPDDVVEPGAMQGEHGPEPLAFSGDEGTVAKQKPPSPNKARQTSANKGGRAPRKTAPPAPAPADETQGQGGDEKQAAPQGGGDGGPGGGD
ncbi:hypothetical protein [Streptomyces cyaneofuscatus]|uniref:hypothetical protein n=1 Tax=Streptomyces cyaneofuscatus TaxID=66883 RepID=UPI0013DB18F6|nr:hypothetical protein [Streptomyces cyaneofuscatus]NDZ63564.1 hypothetical protein [Streptomyces cyaneofuscatus]